MRDPRQSTWLVLVIGLVVIALAGLLTYANHRYGQEKPGGSDFLVLWEGTRSFLGEAISPYSDEAAGRIADRLAEEQIEPAGSLQLFLSPLYSIFIVLPFTLISDFPLARAIWMTVLELALIALAFFSIRLVRWRIGPLTLVVFVLFTIFFVHGLRPLVVGNLSILVALFLVSGFHAVRGGADEIAGIMFGLATIKPQLVIILLVFVTIWSIRRRRWKIPVWTAMTVVLLSAVAALLMPNWILANLRAFLEYSRVGGLVASPAEAIAAILPALGGRIGSIFSILMITLMLVEWWFARTEEIRSFLWVACLTLAASQWSGISTTPDNFIVLIPGLALVLAALEERWRGVGRALGLIGMAVLFAGTWAIFFSSAKHGLLSAPNPALFIPVPLFTILALYWVRWWAVQPPNLWFDMLSQERRY